MSSVALSISSILSSLNISDDVVKEQELPDDLTEEEAKFLDPKYWYDIHPFHEMKGRKIYTQTSCDALMTYHAYPLGVIRGAYIKLRKEETDVIQVFRDDVVVHTLFHLAASLRRMKDFSLHLRAVSLYLLQKIPRAAAAAESLGLPKSSPNPKKRDSSEECKGTVCGLTHMGCNERNGAGTFVNYLKISNNSQEQKSFTGSEKLSNIYHILLILKEILCILQVNNQSEVCEGHRRFVNGNLINDPSAKLMGLVEAGMRQLKTELKQEHSSFVVLIDFVYAAYAPTSVEYKEGRDCDLLRHKLNSVLYSELCKSFSYLSEADGAMSVAFQDLIEVIDVFSPVDPIYMGSSSEAGV